MYSANVCLNIKRGSGTLHTVELIANYLPSRSLHDSNINLVVRLSGIAKAFPHGLFLFALSIWNCLTVLYRQTINLL